MSRKSRLLDDEIQVGRVRMPVDRAPREPSHIVLRRIAGLIQRGSELSASERGVAALFLLWAADREYLLECERMLKRPTAVRAELAFHCMRVHRSSRKAAILHALGGDQLDVRAFNRVARALDRLLGPEKKKATKRT